MVCDYKDFAEYILRYYPKVRIVEIGIGADFRVFKELKRRNADIKAVDISPSSGDVIRDDVLSPDMDLYAGSGLIYSVRPPPELIQYIAEITRRVGADLIIRPLSTDNVPANGKLKNYKSAMFYMVMQRQE
ncbi:MAG: UPF0146 family protein [Candidatus Hydrothermarchaeaceae archaeon]